MPEIGDTIRVVGSGGAFTVVDVDEQVLARMVKGELTEVALEEPVVASPTIKELKAELEARGIEAPKGAKKAVLIALLEPPAEPPAGPAVDEEA